MFKFLMVTAFVAIVSAATTSSSEDGVNGIALASAPEPPAKATCPSGSIGNVCANDCKTLMVCTKDSTEPLVENWCSDLSSTASPFCIPGRTGCSVTGNPNITTCAVKSTFICTNNGYFPDPTNCTRYHICSDNVAETYQCPPNYVYDGVNYKCKANRYTTDCVTAGCTTATANKYIVYSPNKAYYTFCRVSSGVSNPIMFRCEDTVNFQFNPTRIGCEFVCKAEGWYPDVTDCTKYYECYKSGATLLSNLQNCPPSNIFDSVQGRCIKGQCHVNEGTNATGGDDIS